MKIPIIKVRKKDNDIICSITYDGVTLKAGYQPDGTTFVLSNRPIIDIANEFTRIGVKMWGAVCDKFNLNPGYALEAGLINLKYCKQMQFASIIGYDLCGMSCYKQKSNRNMEEFFEKNLK